jgi:5'-3' exonuclease
MCLVDADSIVYILAWHYKDFDEIASDVVKQACDKMVQSILMNAKATHYIGSFSSPKNFRHEKYLYAPYKGARKEKEDYVARWEPIIKDHLCEKWNFIIPTDLEADDIICALWYLQNPEDKLNTVIASPDKDLRQIPTWHLDYRKMDDGMKLIDIDQANINFWKQMLMGDSTDNVKAIPGLGEVKVGKLFNELADKEDWTLQQCVKEQYIKYFGDYYGDIIYQETLLTIQLLQPTHIMWPQYADYVSGLKDLYVKEVPDMENDGLDGTMLKELGW